MSCETSGGSTTAFKDCSLQCSRRRWNVVEKAIAAHSFPKAFSQKKEQKNWDTHDQHDASNRDCRGSHVKGQQWVHVNG